MKEMPLNQGHFSIFSKAMYEQRSTMTEFEIRLTRLMEDCIRQLRNIGIAPSQNIVGICENRRAKKRLGCCRILTQGRRKKYQIEIASILKEAEDTAIKEVILHELLHTCPGCFNHGTNWKKLVMQVNRAYGYQITRLGDYGKFALLDLPERPYKYRIQCIRCGTISYRRKRSKVIQCPQNYRCSRCGGALEVDQI